MVSFHVESLVTNISLQETIDLCVQKPFEDRNYIDGLSKDSFCEMVTVTMTVLLYHWITNIIGNSIE